MDATQTSQKVVPSLWFDHVAREAVDFYLTVFPDSAETHVSRYPEQGLPEFQQEFAGQPVEIRFRIANLEFNAINAGPEFTKGTAISFLLNFDPASDPHAAEHLDDTWVHLADGGEVFTDLGPQPWSARYGSVRDRFGVTWQLMLPDPKGDPRPFVVPQITFPHTAATARTAMDYWTSVFPDAHVGAVMGYPDSDTSQVPGAVMFAEFQLAGQWFSAMDSWDAPSNYAPFNEGVSFIVNCADQSEIDHFWDALSSVPEAEQCGWCKDRFDMSWQVVPDNMDDLMTKPDAYRKMVAMKKIVIADFD